VDENVDKYKKLLSNTWIFALGTVSSKVLTFLLMPVYTRLLTSAEFGLADLLLQTAHFMFHIASLGILHAVLRFGLDRASRKSDVFTVGLLSLAAGFGLLLLARPLIENLPVAEGYGLLIYLFVFSGSLRSLLSQFVRAKGMVALFSLDNLLSTITLIGFNLLFLTSFEGKVAGYIGALVASNALSAFFLFWRGALWRDVRLRGIDRQTAAGMFRYCLPMVPNTLFWWVVGAAGRYILSSTHGNEANGLYAVAFKIPSLVLLVSSIFMDAWQMAAVSEGRGREKFFTRVFGTYASLLFMAGAGVILYCRLLTGLLAAPGYYESWRYIPFLTLSAVFSCLVNFMGTVYMVEKRSGLSLFTTAVGAAASLGLNLLLIPRFGILGAALASFASYFAIFVIRLVGTGRLMKVRWNVGRVVSNLLLLLAEGVVLLAELPRWELLTGGLAAACVLWNIGPVFKNFRRLFFPGVGRRFSEKNRG